MRLPSTLYPLPSYRRRITTVDVRMLSLAVLSVLLMLVRQSHHLLQLWMPMVTARWIPRWERRRH